MEPTRLIDARPGWLSTNRVATSNAAAIVALVVGVVSITYDRQATAVKTARDPPHAGATAQSFFFGPHSPNDVETFVRVEDPLTEGQREFLYSSEARPFGDVVNLVLPDLTVPSPPPTGDWVTQGLTDEIAFQAVRYDPRPERKRKLPVLSWQWVNRTVDNAVANLPEGWRSGRISIDPKKISARIIDAATFGSLKSSDWSTDVVVDVIEHLSFVIRSSVIYKLYGKSLSDEKPEESSTQADESFKCTETDILWLDYVRWFELSGADKTRFCNRLKSSLRKHLQVIVRKLYVVQSTKSPRKRRSTLTTASSSAQPSQPPKASSTQPSQPPKASSTQPSRPRKASSSSPAAGSSSPAAGSSSPAAGSSSPAAGSSKRPRRQRKSTSTRQ